MQENAKNFGDKKDEELQFFVFFDKSDQI